jgi:hypothetical protein
MTRPRRFLALTMLVTATVALLGSPAGAAPDGEVTADVFLRDLTVPADGPAVEDHLSFFLTSDRAGWADEVTVSVDTSAAASVFDVAVEEASPEVTCATTGPVVRCTVPGPHEVVDPPEGSFGFTTSASVLLRLTPKAGAAAGDAGTLTVTARADDGPTTTETARVRIGEGVNLTAVDGELRTVPAGGTTALRPQVRNTGARDVDGLVLATYASEGLLAGTNFGNCTYDDAVICTFASTVAAGRTYRVSAPFTVQIPRDAAVGSSTEVGLQWLTLAEWEDLLATFGGLPGARQGTGADLELDELASAAAAGVPQADTDQDDNGTYSRVTVTGGRRTDVVAAGAGIAGLPGDARTIDVGLVNSGPGTLHYPPFYNAVPLVSVTLPPGVTVVKADARCRSLYGDGPPPSSPAAEPSSGAEPVVYDCWPRTVRLLPGQRLSYAFTVRVDPGADDGEGSVEVATLDDDAGVDRDTGNNSAPITLKVGGAGGGLPVTGRTTATVAGAGVLLLLAGIAVTVALRRRNRAA